VHNYWDIFTSKARCLPAGEKKYRRSILGENMSKTDDITSDDLSELTGRIQAGLRCDHPGVWLFLLRALGKG